MILSSTFRDALDFAFDLHQEQERKGSGVPYVAHLLGVSSLVLEHGGDEEQAIAGLLHDAVEDQGGLETAAEIRKRFGERVADIVMECTDSHSEPRPPWRARKEAYLEKLGRSSQDATLVASCDKLYNLRTIVSDLAQDGDLVWTRFSGGREGVVWYYQELAKRLPAPPALRRELALCVEALVAFAEPA
jgi:(p)ppGpp synthase/HD superfamily hydrolase